MRDVTATDHAVVKRMKEGKVKQCRMRCCFFAIFCNNWTISLIY